MAVTSWAGPPLDTTLYMQLPTGNFHTTSSYTGIGASWASGNVLGFAWTNRYYGLDDGGKQSYWQSGYTVENAANKIMYWDIMSVNGVTPSRSMYWDPGSIPQWQLVNPDNGTFWGKAQSTSINGSWKPVTTLGYTWKDNQPSYDYPTSIVVQFKFIGVSCEPYNVDLPACGPNDLTIYAPPDYVTPTKQVPNFFYQSQNRFLTEWGLSTRRMYTGPAPWTSSNVFTVTKTLYRVGSGWSYQPGSSDTIDIDDTHLPYGLPWAYLGTSCTQNNTLYGPGCGTSKSWSQIECIDWWITDAYYAGGHHYVSHRS